MFRLLKKNCFWVLCLVLVSCLGNPEPPPGLLSISYPLPGAVVPPDMVAPSIVWEDVSAATAWKITVGFEANTQTFNGESGNALWRPDAKTWDKVKELSTKGKAVVTVTGLNKDKPVSRGQTWITTSTDPVGAPIFYRDLPLPFATALRNLENIKWRFGPISSETGPPTVLTNMPVCGNCHSFSGDGKILAMDADYGTDKGAYAITDVASETILGPDQIISWSDFRPDDGQLTFGLLSQISPDGRYVLSTVKDRSVFVPREELHYSQFFFPVQGILALYDRQSKSFSALGGADDPDLVQSNPSWSPDGQRVLFTRTTAYPLKNLKNKYAPVLRPEDVQEFISGQAVMRYDLYQVDFNQGKGGISKPLPGASENGRSNFFPKYSPDGKWLVFCQADHSMLLRPDSELYIMPAQGGTARRMNCNMSGSMNSWHSWSPNGRWLVFASKKNGPYTQLWLTHIDETGMDSPPVLLEKFTDPDRAANIPEFVNAAPEAIQSIVQSFNLPLEQHIRRGDRFMGTGDYTMASREFASALNLSPGSSEIMYRLSTALLAQGRVPQALELAEKAAVLTPDDADLLYVMASCLLRSDQLEQAVGQAQKALASNPDHEPSRLILARSLVLQGRIAQALPLYDRSMKAGMVSADLYNEYGEALVRTGQFDKAIGLFQKALALRGNQERASRNLNNALDLKAKKAGK